MSDLIPATESESVEFKTSFSQDVIDTLTAFANTHGGNIYVGVTDKRDVVGVTLGKESVPKWLNEIRTKTSPSLIPDVDIIEVNDRTVVVFSQPEFPIKPVSVLGRYFVRRSASNYALSISDVVMMHLKTFNTSWDYYVDSVHNLDSISIDKINNAIVAIQKRRQAPIAEAPLDFLRKMELLRDDQVTNAAFLLFTTEDTSLSTIELGRFQTDTIIKDSARTKSDIISQSNQVMDFVKKHINKEIVITGNAENEERWQYPLDAIREIIMNMIVHRDYRSSSDSIVKIYNDRIEFYNPGGLPDGLTIEKLLSNNYISAPRNKKIADFFKEMGLIEKYGSGIRRIITPFKKQGTRLPDFESVQSGWRVTVYASDKLEYTGQTSDKSGQTRDKSGLTSDKSGQTSDKSGQTSDKSGLTSDKLGQTSDKILSILQQKESASTAEIATILSLSLPRCRAILASMVKQGVLIAVGNNKNRRYKLNS